MAPPITPKPIHIRAPEVPEKELVAGLEKPEQSPAFKAGVTIALAVAALALCVAAFFGWRYLESKKTALATSSPAHPAGTPAPAVPASGQVTPAQALSAENLAAQRTAEQARVDALASAEDGPVKIDLDHPAPTPAPVAGKPAAGKFSNSPSPVAATVAPGVMAKMDVSVSNSGASPEFRAFVANVKITGIFQGANARAFINGRITHVGETVESRLGIVFDSIDADKKQIIFKDASGAIATRKY